jgi:hypothetical protein
MMKRMTRKRILYVLALAAAHAAAISGGIFFRQQVAHAQMEPEIRYGKKYVDSDGNLIACDCTKPLKECACQTGE